MVYTRGARFVDEGADSCDYTYATYGKAVLRQLGGLAFQIFDGRAARWLREEEYGERCRSEDMC